MLDKPSIVMFIVLFFVVLGSLVVVTKLLRSAQKSNTNVNKFFFILLNFIDVLMLIGLSCFSMFFYFNAMKFNLIITLVLLILVASRIIFRDEEKILKYIMMLLVFLLVITVVITVGGFVYLFTNL